MKKILWITFLAGAAAATAVILLTRKTPGEKTADAAEDAFDTMNKHLKKVENITEAATGLK